MPLNKDNTKITYWNLAVLKDHADAEKILAKIPDTEDVNQHNNTDKIPLLYAVSNNSIQVINILLRMGGDVNFNAPNGDTPISLAIKRGDPEILQSLISFGAKISSEESQKASFILSRVTLKKSELPDTLEIVADLVNELSLKRERREIEEQKTQEEIEEKEFEQLVSEMRSLGLTESKMVSWYITNNRLGHKYKNISGIVKMEQDGTSWEFKGGFPPKIYARLCEELGLRNQGTRARVIGFKPFKDL